jgi:hypothetical protein
VLPVPEKQEPAPVAVRPRQRLPLTAALLGCGALLLVNMILGVAIGSVPLIQHPETGTPHLIPRRARSTDPAAPGTTHPPGATT